ncbi:MAG TPA: MATE family efflux transporter [Saprospiraceae bacterium]|nr:MATE family efflux transporter [Saprospiraceae bacterium]
MNKEILRLAIPNIVSNISVPLLSTVDTLLMGRLSAAHLGAVGLGSMIFNFIYWNFGFLRMGTTGMTAQEYGKRNQMGISGTLYRALLLSLILAFIVILLQKPVFEAASFLLNVSNDQSDLVFNYFFIRIFDAPAALMLYVLLGWFFGMQNATIPLILTVFINMMNITLSAYLVHVQGLGISGVAIGTVVSQYAGVILAFGFLFLKFRDVLLRFRWKVILIWEDVRIFLHVNKDLFIRTVMLTFAFGFFYSRSSQSGEIILAVNVVLLQFVNWMSYGIDGFAYAAESIIGKYKGMDDRQKLKQAIRLIFLWGLAFALFYICLYAFTGKSLLYIFTNQKEVIDAAIPYMVWMAVFPVLAFPSYLWDGIFIGLTASRAMRDSMFISLALYIAAYYLLEPAFGNHGLWAALLVFLMARGVLQYGLYELRGGDLN